MNYTWSEYMTCCSSRTAADVACSMLVVVAFGQQGLAAVQGLPRPLNAAASMHAGAAATLINVNLTLTSIKPWNEEADNVSEGNSVYDWQHIWPVWFQQYSQNSVFEMLNYLTLICHYIVSY